MYFAVERGCLQGSCDVSRLDLQELVFRVVVKQCMANYNLSDWRTALETRIFPDLSDDDRGGDNVAAKGQLQAGVTLARRYLIQEVVGLGGMGSVYRARDLHFPSVTKLVAVKEMVISAPDPLVRDTIVQNFEREANLLATLHHSSIPKIYDYFTMESRSYLVLEFIHGKDMEAVINETNGFLPEEQVLTWAIDLCDVLDYLHKHKPDPIIFRDMKPSNVMINSNGEIVLVDFGIAKSFQSGMKGTMIGTEGYSPPEQYRGEATQAADIYSLGATIHHALTRRDPRLEPPFSFAERPIRRINPSVSSELEVIVNRALEYDPASRFKSALEMRDALAAAARKTGMLVRKSAHLGPVKTDGIKPLWKFKSEDEIRGTPAIFQGSLYIGSYDHNLYALDAADGKFQWKYPTEGGIVSRPVVADGNIYVGSEDKLLHVVSARSGKVVWTYYTDGPIRSSPRIAEGHVFIGSDDGYLHAVNINTGRMVWRFESADAIRSTPFVMNEMVYFGNESGDYYAVNFGGELKWRFRAEQAIYFTSVDSALYALDPRNGWMLWRFRLGKASISTPCVADDLIIMGASDGFIYAVEARNGKEAWRFRADHQVNGSPVIHKDSVYCGSVDGNLYCIEYRTGRLRWKFGTEGAITGTPLVYDDIVYVGSTDHQVYALLA
jgi:eukaryotic-like serine/threonine-protein kinase